MKTTTINIYNGEEEIDQTNEVPTKRGENKKALDAQYAEEDSELKKLAIAHKAEIVKKRAAETKTKMTLKEFQRTTPSRSNKGTIRTALDTTRSFLDSTTRSLQYLNEELINMYEDACVENAMNLAEKNPIKEMDFDYYYNMLHNARR